jgi:hypothetical protein
MADSGGRLIDTDTLRISPVVQVSGDGQEREQDSDDMLMRIWPAPGLDDTRLS